MRAVIVAAGLSSRLYPLTKDKPKSLLKINNTTILQRNIAILKKLGIKEIYIVTGYLDEQIQDTLGNEVNYIYNPYYEYCNNMGSLYTSKPYLEGETFIYLHADIIYTSKIIENLLKYAQMETNKAIYLAVDFKETDEEAMKVSLKPNGDLLKSDKIIASGAVGEWTGIAYIADSKTVFSYIEQVLREGLLQKYDTFAFTRMAEQGIPIACHSINKQKWIEVDFLEDYQEAQRMFVNE